MTKSLDLNSQKKIPVVIQSEAAECGLACLAMIAQFHGIQAPLNGLRMVVPVSMRGASLKSLLHVADRLGLRARPVRAEMEYLKQIPLPAILHWNLNHFVVLVKIKGDKYKIHDPGIGARWLNKHQMSDQFTGVAVELESDTSNLSNELNIPSIPTPKLSDFWSNITGLKSAILQISIITLIFYLFIIIAPLFVQLVIDEALLRSDKELLISLAVFFGSITVLSVISSFMRSWTIAYFSSQLTYQMMGNIFTHLLRLPVSFYEKRHLGDILSRMESVKPIRQMLSETVVVVFIDAILAITTLIIIFIYSVKIGLAVSGFAFISLLIVLLLYPFLFRANEEALITEAEERSSLMESLRGITAIKLQGREIERNNIWKNLYANFVNKNLTVSKFQFFIANLKQLVDGLQLIVVVYIGASIILVPKETKLTIGMLVAILAYRATFSQSLSAFVDKMIQFRLLKLHLQRLSDIVSQPPEPKAIATEFGEKLEEVKSVEFRDVWFRYSPNDPWVLKGVNLNISQNEFVSIVGKSGEGKSTLLNLLLGLYEPERGEIIVNGKKLSALGYKRWRKALGIVRQNDTLFGGTIAENISFFDAGVALDTVQTAAASAQILDDIDEMPMKFQSLIGDMGSALSGGQKQRLLLARALYSEPSALILDEGTANLDPETEAKVVDVIKNLKMIRITVTHRVLINEHADSVYRLRSGILERVSHA